jgi:methylase of polypeptide subunit release factors
LRRGIIDNFSTQSKEYSFSRPTYPDSLFKFLSAITPRKNLAWDCGTGNGQAAIGLSKYFESVIASDASKNQILHAFQRKT